MQLINTAIISRPINWFTVLLMVWIASIAMHLILKHYNEPDVVTS